MAKNISRTGCVRGRDQVWNPKTKRWTKRKKQTGRFMDQKADKEPFKGVRKRQK